jgi:adenine-specific DNA methylase
MAKPERSGITKAARVARAVADAVGAGKAVQVETVDFNDPNRPKTCLEVDFPILPVNQVAAIEGNAGKPIYQMSKWWARRRSSVFRSLLLSASMKAPEDTSQAAKAVWDVYYANHQKKCSFANLKVADIFMGGGTTVVEGSRLGMQMFGNDLNPVAWFVVKTELADVKKAEVEALLADIEAEVKPQIMPFYACNGPHGERGTWTRLSDGKVMDESFDPLALKPEERKAFKYEGPEIIYVFWSKHGPCQVMGCGHRTPVMSSPVLAVKELSIKAWPHKCPKCKTSFDIEESEARMAPDVSLVVADGEPPFAPIAKNGAVVCPSCGQTELVNVGRQKGTKKKVSLSLLVHPQWLQGEKSQDQKGQPYGGSVTDDAETSARWYEARAKTLRLLEVRGTLPDEVTCPDTGVTFSTSTGTIPKRSSYACGACGTVQDVLTTVKASGKSGPVAPYAIQAYSPKRDRDGVAYGGRYFLPTADHRAIAAAGREWNARKDADLGNYWPRSEVPFGFMTHQNNGGIPNHGFTHWWTMFNPRQLLVNALLLKAINEVGGDKHRWEVREYVLAAFQQYLRNQNMFTLWNTQADKLEPMFANNNYHPKSTVVENCVFPTLGRGNWASCSESLLETLVWSAEPWELVSNERLKAAVPALADELSGKSEKAQPGDPVLPGALLACGSATDLEMVATSTFDLVITDPPFGGLLHYSELADFFHVWLKLVLKGHYPDQFGGEYTPKTLEAVSNRARHPDDADAYYQRLLTASWKEAHRILKPGGTLAFTFHHSEDEPWVSVLESLFEAGFYLEATWPIRSDETKGEGSKPGTFGSQKIEFDILHVCRKRTEDPTPVSWAKMRKQVLQDVSSLKQMLEHHSKAGLPEQDLRIIKIGKSLEYYSRHYGQVFFGEERAVDVKDALLAIFQLIDEESGAAKEPPPVNAEPITRQFLRLFDGAKEIPRDQIQKFLRGTGVAPSDFEARGWCSEDNKTYNITSPLEVARAWQGKHRRGMTSDYDQAAFLIGACFENSGINATDTLSNDNFKPHPALDALLEWFAVRGASSEIRNASSRAQTILRSWRAKHESPKQQQMALFFEDQGAA